MSDEIVKRIVLNEREPRFNKLQELLDLPRDQLYGPNPDEYDSPKRKSLYHDQVTPILCRLIESSDAEVRIEAGKIFVQQIQANEGRAEQEHLVGVLASEIQHGLDSDSGKSALDALKSVLVNSRGKPLHKIAVRELMFSIDMGYYLQPNEKRELFQLAFDEQSADVSELLSKQQQGILSPDVKFEQPFEPWQKDFVEALQSGEVFPLRALSEPEEVTTELKQVQTPMTIIEKTLNTGKPEDPQRLERSIRTQEFGITVETNEGVKRVKLRPLDLIRLRRYRYKEALYPPLQIIQSHLYGLDKKDVFKHVAFLTEAQLAGNIDSLRGEGLFGDPNPNVPTYLQWGDCDATTYGGLSEEKVRRITLIIDPYLLAQYRKTFIDPESLLQVYSRMGSDNRVLELPGDLVMVFGGIPKSAIVGVSFSPEVNISDPKNYLVDVKFILARI